MKTPLVIDIETSGTPWDPGSLLVFGWQLVGEPRAHVVLGEQVPHWVWEMLADPERPKVEMTKYDARWNILQGHPVRGPIWDLQVMAWVLNENQSLSLENLVRRYCHVQMDKRLRVRDGEVYFECDDGQVVHITMAPPDQLLAYCARDVEAETELFQTLWEYLADTSHPDGGTWLDYYLREEAPYTPVLVDMEVRGLPVDLEESEKLRQELEVEHERMAQELLNASGLPSSFNLASNPQVGLYLFEKAFELTESLVYDTWTLEALKSCVNGEHEDCPVVVRIDAHAADPTIFTEHEYHVVDLLPVGFTPTSYGRTQVHGVWTLKGRGLPVGRKAPKCEAGECDCAGKHKPSTSSPALQVNLATAKDEWCQAFLKYRKVDKLLTTYLRKFPVVAHEGRIYARFNQTGTKTGRLSSSEPNLQNIPSHGEYGDRVRALFKGTPDRPLVVGDYSQLEPRLMAHFSEDPLLLDVYRNDRDIYLTTAQNIFGGDLDKDSEERGISKVLVLAMGYGAMQKMVAQILTINGYPTDPDTAKDYLTELRATYPVFFDWRDQVIARVKRTGYVQTIGGRHRRLKAQFADRRNWKNVGYGERQAVNAEVQGSAGDLVRDTMLRWPIPNLPMLAQVHDELVAQYVWGAPWAHPDRKDGGELSMEQIRHDLRRIQDVGENPRWKLNVPLKFEPMLAMTWADKGKGIELPEEMSEDSIDYEEER